LQFNKKIVSEEMRKTNSELGSKFKM